MQKKFQTTRYWLLVSLIFAAPMSFLPSIALPIFDFPSFRIGLYQVLAVLFVVAGMPLLLRPAGWHKNRWLLVGTGFISSALIIGLATTSSPTRTLLYGASLVALLVLGIVAFLTWQELTREQIASFKETLLWSGITFGGFAVLQLIIASFNPTAFGTLCTGCSDAVFGFPRINGFAAEPQFSANSLLPALFASVFFRTNKPLANWSLVLTALAIGLTFSRGAFLAIAVSAFVYVIVQLLAKRPVGSFVRCVGIAFVSIIAAFGLLVGSATLRYHDTPYITFNTTASMLDHLTLGVINIEQKVISTPLTTDDSATNNFQPEGLVEESSNDRLSAASLALEAWNDSLKTLLFGVGMGNLGAYVNHSITQAPSNLTVYIWYVLVLAELGIIGLAGLLLAPLYVLWRLVAFGLSTPLRALVFTVTVAFLVQLFSFGTYINIMYGYLFVGIFVAVASRTTALRTP